MIRHLRSFITARRATGLLFMAILPLAGFAFPLSDGTETSCMVSRDGRSGPATEHWVQYDSIQNRDPELGKAVAVVRADAQGWPVIYIDAVAHKRGSRTNAGLWDFVFLHECAHAKDLKLTEIEAN